MTDRSPTPYRQSAVARLSTPDQLDRVVAITDARGWLALTILVLLTAIVVAWGVLGRVPVTVSGRGLLITEGGRVVSGMAPADGRLRALRVRIGDSVHEGQTLAVLTHPELQQDLTNARDALAERQAELRERRAALGQELELRRSTLGKRRAALEQLLAAARQRLHYLRERLAGLQDLREKGYTTLEAVQDARADINKAEQERMDARARLLELEAEENEIRLAHRRELNDLRAAKSKAERRVRSLETRLAEAVDIVAPADGRVTGMQASVGALVDRGQPVVSIETAGAGLQAVTYVPTGEGKKIEPGMAARLSPDTVEKREHGSLRGRVATVSEFPVSRAAMRAVLQNDTLVEDLARKGAPYAVRIDLQAADTPSGFAWTSGSGPALSMTSGTTLEAEVVVRERRPIDLVLPLLRETLGGA